MTTQQLFGKAEIWSCCEAAEDEYYRQVWSEEPRRLWHVSECVWGHQHCPGEKVTMDRWTDRWIISLHVRSLCKDGNMSRRELDLFIQKLGPMLVIVEKKVSNRNWQSGFSICLYKFPEERGLHLFFYFFFFCSSSLDIVNHTLLSHHSGTSQSSDFSWSSQRQRTVWGFSGWG